MMRDKYNKMPLVSKKAGISGTVKAGAAMAIIIAAGTLALQILPDDWASGLRYDRAAVISGEYWRLLSGHFVHLGLSHWALNMAGLAVLLVIPLTDSPVRWLVLWSTGAVLLSLLIFAFSPEMLWYAGLSGLLHCWITAAAIRGIRPGLRSHWLLLALLLTKVLAEQWLGAGRFSTWLTGGPVAVDAHLWGVVLGVMYGICLRRW